MRAYRAAISLVTCVGSKLEDYMQKEPVHLFYSYSHKDEKFREDLETHLSILKRKGDITDWHDRKIVPGAEWEKSIDQNIEKADIILLLISSDFIASDYCYGRELEVALERHEAGKCMVVPVIIRPVEWSDSPFSKIQALPKDGIAVTNWKTEDEAWLDVVRGVRSAVGEILKNRVRPSKNLGPIKVNELIKKEFKRIERVYENKSHCGGLSTGFHNLDKLVDGLHPGDLFVLASCASMGKVDLAINIASNVGVLQNIPVAYFSLKLPSEHIMRKLTSSTSVISHDRLVRAHFKLDDWPKITRAIGKLSNAPVFIDESPSLSLELIRERARKLKDENGLGVIIIDSVQHLQEFEQKGDRHHKACIVGRSLKSIAKEMQVPIVVLSSLTNEPHLRPNKRPLMADLGDWEGLVEYADVVFLLYRDDIYNPIIDNSRNRTIEILIAKNNYGGVAPCYMDYYPEYSGVSAPPKKPRI